MARFIRYLIGRFGASLSEARAFVVLLVLIGLVLLATAVLRWFPTSPAPHLVVNTQLQNELNQWWAGQQKQSGPGPELLPVQHFPFDPNQISADSLKLLGFSRLIANRIVSYRNKVGAYTTKEDLKKIYDLPAETFQELYPYILLPPASEKKGKLGAGSFRTRTPEPGAYAGTKAAGKDYRIRQTLFDLNLADTTQLRRIRGVGPVLSRRIVKFRDKLGGFVRPEQVREVYGLPPQVADSLLAYGKIAPAFEPRKLNVNTASREELAAHPYLSWSTARLIEQYRQQHGYFTDSAALYRIHGLEAQDWHKLSPYLTFE